MPKISLVLPLYNAEKYLIPCLESVKNQTFSDFECLSVNDGSTDQTLKIVQEYAKKDPRFIVIDQKNQGCSEARNTGIQAATSPYLMFLDQDDFFHPQAMETLLYLVETHKTDIAGFDYQNVSDDFDINEVATYHLPSLKPGVSKTPLNDFLTQNPRHQILVWLRIYKKDVVADLRFPKDVQPAEDTTYSMKVFHRIQSMVSIKEPLLFYRAQNSACVSSQKLTRKFIFSHAEAARVLFTYFSDQKLEEQTKKNAHKYINELVYKGCIAHIYRWVKNRHDRQPFIDYAYPIVNQLVEDGIFVPSKLTIFRRLKAYLFMKKYFVFIRFL